MQSLATSQLMMTWLSMYPAGESTTPRQKRMYIAFTLIVMLLTVTGLTASLAYCLKFLFTDFDGAMFSFMIAIEEFGLIYFTIAAILMRYQIESIFTSLSTIYKSNEDEMEFRYLAGANNICEHIWPFYFKYIAFSIGSVAATSLFSVLYGCLIHGDFNIVHFHRPAKYVFPWNQATYAGYFAEICITMACAGTALFLIGIHLVLFTSLCLHHQAFCKMFKQKIDKSKQCDTKLLCDLICFHLSAKDWFLSSAKVYRSFVLVQLICGTVMMTISVFYFDLQWHHIDFTVVSVMLSTSVGISNLLFYCYFGKLATESYEMMPDCLYNMDWYEHPNELQKFFILMIQNMQKPVYYHGFDVAKLDLRTFIKLCNSVLSYYMAIKTISSK